MELFEAIQSRNSYRGAFLNSPVPRTDLTAMMEARLAAPSGCNKQSTSVVAIDDPDVLNGIKALMPSQIAGNAPALLLVLTEKKYSFYIQDYSAAIENILLAAKALGYDSCWREGQITDENNIGGKIAEYLRLPAQYSVVALLPVGKAAEAPVRVTKKPFSSRAWFNRVHAEPGE